MRKGTAPRSFLRAARRDGARSEGSGPRPVPGRSAWSGTNGWDGHRASLVFARCTPGRRAVRGKSPVPCGPAHRPHEPDSEARQKHGTGKSREPAGRKACATAAVHGKWAATGPRSQRSVWHEWVGRAPRLARFYALHAGTARGPREVGRDRSPVAALGLARMGGKGTVPRSFLRAARRDGARSVGRPLFVGDLLTMPMNQKEFMEENIQHSTFNFEHPRASNSRAGWRLGVEC
jgi:hypothetical protein